MNIEEVRIEKDAETNVIIGQSHFIKTAEDLYEALVNSVPQIKFGLAFCEASADRLVRSEGNDEELQRSAEENAKNIGAGHSFVIMVKDAYPINILNSVKAVREVCTVFCATANDVSVLVADNGRGRGVIGVIDGEPPVGIEKEEDRKKRREFLRKIGYKK